MKYLPKWFTILLASVALGFLFAGSGTKILKTCPPSLDDPNSGCVSFVKVITLPRELVNNTQGSLTRFFSNFIIGSAFGFVLITISATVVRRNNYVSGQTSKK